MARTYERLLCIVPMVGGGTPEDPLRPMFAPLPETTGEGEAPRGGIIAFTAVASDDGQYALVEFVARDRSAFAPILEARRSGVRVFEKGKARRADILAEFRKHKRDFDLDRFEVRVP
jgi:hypothetical protein